MTKAPMGHPDADQVIDNLRRERVRGAARRAVLTTEDKAKALAWAREIGEKVRVEEITSKPNKR